MFRLLTPYAVDGDVKVYAGELEQVQYTQDFKQRKRAGWPRASEFLCASCAARQASVWDPCHTHGFVRAPLCTPCNTWHWAGWGYDVRRSKKVDVRYLRRCPRRSTGRCSA